MNTYMKKTVSVAVASAIVFSMTGCSFLDKSKDEVLDAADSYAKELAACNIGKLAKLSDEDFEKVQEEWEATLTFSEGELYSADTATVLSAIADTISYEIDEESVEATKKSGEGSVDVTFTIADYSDLLDDDSITSAEDFASAVGDADTKEISVSLEFERTDDGDWLGSNYEKVFGDLYSFTEDEFSFSIPVADAVTSDSLHWYWLDSGSDDSNPVYTNTDEIDGELQIDTSLLDDPNVVYDITYTIERDGQLIYSGTGYDAWVDTYDLTDAELDPDTGYLLPGTYTITFSDPDGNVLASDTCTVIIEAEPADDEPTTGTFADYVGYVEWQTDSSDPFYAGTGSAYWYDRDADANNYGTYASGTTYLELTCSCSDDSLGEATYQYWYSATGADLDQDLGTFTCGTTAYGSSNYYDFTYENGGAALADGYYIVIVSHGGTDQIISVCRVGG